MSIKVGFVGVGGIARAVHLTFLATRDDVKLAAFTDADEQRASAAAAQYGGRAYPDARAMIEGEKLDAVYVCTPPMAHGEAELLAARKGCHLFIEKPVANNLETARAILAEVEKAKVICNVAYQFRHKDVYQKAKEMVAGETPGLVYGSWLDGLPGAPWWRVMDLSGGQMVEQSTHVFDLLRWYGGEVKRVYSAQALRLLKETPNISVPDCGVAILEFQDGLIGYVANCAFLSRPYQLGVRLLLRDRVLELWEHLTVIEPHQTLEIKGGNNPYHSENEAFLKAIQTGDRSLILSDYRDAAKTLAVTVAANESARAGQAVEVPRL